MGWATIPPRPFFTLASASDDVSGYLHEQDIAVWDAEFNRQTGRRVPSDVAFFRAQLRVAIKSHSTATHPLYGTLGRVLTR